MVESDVEFSQSSCCLPGRSCGRAATRPFGASQPTRKQKIGPTHTNPAPVPPTPSGRLGAQFAQTFSTPSKQRQHQESQEVGGAESWTSSWGF